MTPEQIVAEFPQVTVADVHSALTYYHDNRELLEQQDREAEELMRELRVKYPSKAPGRPSRDAGDDSISS
jgi:hypothetical protein